MREIGGMVVPETRSLFSGNLKLRIISTILIVPIPVIIIWNGSWIFIIFLSLLSFLALNEWNKLIGFQLANIHGYIPSLLTAFSLAMVTVFGELSGIALLSFACLSSLVIAREEECPILLAMFGPIYVFLPCSCLIWIREFPIYGLHMVFWLLLVVSTTDISAYIFGGMIKGPKLAPNLSPGKTWSGLVLGVFCATSVGGAISNHMFDSQIFLGSWKWAIGLALIVSVCAQLGDLGESWLKRQTNVKDSGTLIPGHGGLLDRVDGFMISTPLMAIFILCLT